MVKVLGSHESALENMKAALMIPVFVPKPLHDVIETAAKSWKDKAKPGEAHPDNKPGEIIGLLVGSAESMLILSLLLGSRRCRIAHSPWSWL